MPVEIPVRGSERPALVDEVDAHWVARYKWAVQKDGYVVRGVRAGTSALMHRQILGLQRGDPQVDHIDGDPLNNRRSNLRLVTPAQQMQNKRAYKGSTSRYRGVSWNTARQKWCAQVQANGRNRHLGLFESEEAAAECARQARLDLMTHSNEARHPLPRAA